MSTNESPNEFKLDNVGTDCIQSVKFGQHSNQYVLSASWDCSVRLHDISNNTLRCQYNHSAPVLDCAFQVMSILLVIDFVFNGTDLLGFISCLERRV